MASTGINNATLFGLYKDGVRITHATNKSLSISQEMIDISTNDSAGWKDQMPGQRSASGSGEFLFSEDGAVNFEDFFDLVNSRASFTALYTTSVTGDKTYSMTVYVTSIETASGNEEAQTYSISFEATGAVTKATQA